ncbi:hypothetical protein OS493_002336 [Desmophyllum pertusum]|uniref:Uncharacterized protein n=1 Tax=Desmophyllum pertusum TaxID=174260 RepID=A0A9W9YSV8_9CNID|nr:hypothetical protein OS493_002336 [Desmophyllum pertusum]
MSHKLSPIMSNTLLQSPRTIGKRLSKSLQDHVCYIVSQSVLCTTVSSHGDANTARMQLDLPDRLSSHLPRVLLQGENYCTFLLSRPMQGNMRFILPYTLLFTAATSHPAPSISTTKRAHTHVG